MGHSFYSTLAPAGLEPIPGDAPLMIEAHSKCAAEMRLIDVMHLIEKLPDYTGEFVHLELPPQVKQLKQVVCWNCGEDGHLRRDCPNEAVW